MHNFVPKPDIKQDPPKQEQIHESAEKPDINYGTLAKPSPTLHIGSVWKDFWGFMWRVPVNYKDWRCVGFWGCYTIAKIAFLGLQEVRTQNPKPQTAGVESLLLLSGSAVRALRVLHPKA